MVFQLDDWVWIHMWKERFIKQRKSKLYPRRDNSFQVFECINHNAYKIDLPGEYIVSATSNVTNLSLFYVRPDSRMNFFIERGMM